MVWPTREMKRAPENLVSHPAARLRPQVPCLRHGSVSGRQGDVTVVKLRDDERYGYDILEAVLSGGWAPLIREGATHSGK
jgi:hypothetical protein